MRVLLITTFVGLLASHAGAQLNPGTIIKLKEPLLPNSYNKVCGPPAVGSLGKVIKNPFSSSDMPMVLWENRSNCSTSEQKMLVPIKAISPVEGSSPDVDSQLEACSRGICNVLKEEEKWGAGFQKILANEAPCTGLKTKDDDQIEKYLDCYGTKFQDQYRSRYRGIVDVTAEAFHVEPAALKCLLQNQSGWNKDFVSPKCGAGLSQFVPDTAHRLGIFIGDSAARIAKGEKPSGLQQTYDTLMRDLAKADPTATKECSGNFFFVNAKQEYQEQMNGYNSQLMKYYQHIKLKGKADGPEPLAPPACGDACKAGARGDCSRPVIKVDNRGCTRASIAAAALLLKQIEEKNLDVAKKENLNCEDYGDRVISELATAGGADPEPFKISMKNCLAAGGSADWQPPANSEARNCDVPGYPTASAYTDLRKKAERQLKQKLKKVEKQ